MIGLWGPGGIGKTTLAKVIYNAIKGQFEGSSFLDQVRETSNKSDGLVDLQRKLLSHILSPRHPIVYSKDGGISLIRERLCSKKVLLVLDDIDQLDQLKALAGGGDWFGKGSRIFVTTRDRHLLTSSRCKSCVFEVETLKNDEALDLFVWHAFPNSKKVEIRKDLIDGALHYASSLPLALEVLGSFLCGRNEPAWESALHEISNSPNQNIDGVLKTSFKGLSDNEKKIFLDIACFFKGKSKEYIKEVLDGCDFHTTIGIDILVQRSLIKNEHGTLQMHDLVQLMGKNIVKQEGPNDPGKRSRLWLFEDVLHILCENMGTNAIEAIVSDLPIPKDIAMSLEEEVISSDAFGNMKMLRMLILPEVHISFQGPVRLPNNLKWLEWPNAPFLEFGFGLKKLVGLDVQKSHIGDLEGKFKHFRKLKYINFNHCKSLVSVPNLSSVLNLERLNLDGCKSLEEVHQSVACHDKLKFLSLRFCSNLSIFPHKLKAKSLQALDLFGCSKLKKFSDIPGKMEYLEELNLGSTPIQELPASIENLPSVKNVNLRKCKKLKTLPSSVYKWQNLRHLSLEGCSNFVTFPKNLEDSNNPNGNSGFRKLKFLELNGCNLKEVEFLASSSSFPKLMLLNLSKNKFTHMPICINKYKYLDCLILDNCKRIQKIPQLPPNVLEVSANRCQSLQEFPDLSRLSNNWYSVNLSSCRKLFCKGANMAHLTSFLEELPKRSVDRSVDICLPGREMPEWFLPGKDSSISFAIAWDLFDKFLGLAFCFVLGPKGGKAVRGCAQVQIVFDNCRWKTYTRGVHSMESDHLWIEYHPWGYNWRHIQVNFVPETEVELKKCGFRPIYKQQEDGQRIILEPHQPMETNLFSEERESDSDSDNWSDDSDELDRLSYKSGMFRTGTTFWSTNLRSHS